ncbi:hypothetical protein [Rhodocytophaga aerolata]|uniref:hypothetical protein n=1 Tax=Rhodocytophaga aerolata TaxID=455078 RepID=UPI00366D437D
MKNLSFFSLILILLLSLSLSSCAVVGDIFEAGMWVGIIGVVIVIALVIWLLKKLF